MKTMIWKELRENARWAALAFLCLLLAEIYALSSQGTSPSDDSNGVTLCGTTFLMVSALGCALVGAAFGAVQILPELRRDQWASLLHRPVSRGVIFFGKAAAGLALYALATGVPLLVSIAYVAWPGQFAAPFFPRLIVPAASDLVFGMVFYFAALLLGLHRGRWFGVRGAIALGVVAVLVLHLNWGWPFGLPVLAAATLLAAGWGAMIGPVNDRPLASRFALGAVVLVGMQTALFVLGAALQWIAPGASMSGTSTDFAITTDGQIFLRNWGDGEQRTLTDLHGKAITDERYIGNDSGNAFLQTAMLAWYLRDRAEMLRVVFANQPRVSRAYLQLVRGDYGSPELWYLLDGRDGYFVGYDKLSSRCVSICDAEGFHPPGATPRPFASEPQSNGFGYATPTLYWVGSQLYGFDFRDRTMTPLFNAGRDPIYGATIFPYSRNGRSYIAVALSSTIRIFDLHGAPLRTIARGHDSARWPQLEIAATDDLSRVFLEYEPDYYAHPSADHPVTYLDEIDAQGHRIGTYEVAQNNVRPVPPSWGSRLARLATPPLPSLAATLWSRRQPFRLGFAGSPIPGTIDDLTNGELAATGGFALLLGAVAAIWARRSGLGSNRTAAWVALALVFGLAGLLAYRLATDWPTRVACPRCRRARSVRARACSHCREAWSSPVFNGTEIFES